MEVKVYRDCDKRLRLRKVVVETWFGEQMLDRCRLFAGLGFARRLARKIARSKRRAEIMLTAMKQAG